MVAHDVRPGHRFVRAAVAVALVLAVILLAAARTTEGPAITNADLSSSASLDAAMFKDSPTGTRVDRAHDGPILVLGDSLTLGADEHGFSKELKADGWQPQIVAETGRSTRGGILALQQDVKVVPPLVIVELGTNPSSAVGTFAAEVDTMVDQLHARGAQRIVWITPVHHDDDRYDDKVNILLAKAAADHSVVVADWRSIAWAHKSWFRSDGLHYIDAGWVGLAQFMVDAANANDPS